MVRFRLGLTVLLVFAYIPIFGSLAFLWATGYLGDFLHGPSIVESVPSPDRVHVAYVEEYPSIDPPNQSLLIETADKTRFLVIADLVEDVDAIQEIRWSPDSQIVVFLSRCYLTATRVSDWQTIRIYLGKEWVRSQPAHGSTFSGAQPIRTVNEIRFPTPDTVAYLTNDRQDWCFIQMNSGQLPSRKLSKAQERKQNHNAPDKSDGARNT